METKTSNARKTFADSLGMFADKYLAVNTEGGDWINLLDEIPKHLPPDFCLSWFKMGKKPRGFWDAKKLLGLVAAIADEDTADIPWGMLDEILDRYRPKKVSGHKGAEKEALKLKLGQMANHLREGIAMPDDWLHLIAKISAELGDAYTAFVLKNVSQPGYWDAVTLSRVLVMMADGESWNIDWTVVDPILDRHRVVTRGRAERKERKGPETIRENDAEWFEITAKMIREGKTDQVNWEWVEKTVAKYRDPQAPYMSNFGSVNNEEAAKRHEQAMFERQAAQSKAVYEEQQAKLKDPDSWGKNGPPAEATKGGECMRQGQTGSGWHDYSQPTTLSAEEILTRSRKHMNDTKLSAELVAGEEKVYRNRRHLQALHDAINGDYQPNRGNMDGDWLEMARRLRNVFDQQVPVDMKVIEAAFKWGYNCALDWRESHDDSGGREKPTGVGESASPGASVAAGSVTPRPDQG